MDRRRLGSTAGDAIKALGLYRHDDALRQRVRSVAARRERADLRAAIAEKHSELVPWASSNPRCSTTCRRWHHRLDLSHNQRTNTKPTLQRSLLAALAHAGSAAASPPKSSPFTDRTIGKVPAFTAEVIDVSDVSANEPTTAKSDSQKAKRVMVDEAHPSRCAHGTDALAARALRVR
jgi:hypothetical protein